MDPILIKHVREPQSFTLDFYLRHEGYQALKLALGKKPDEIVEMVKASGLRGRGGAGFPTGMKWQFVDKKIEPRYIACNADESEPGTFKDHLLMERNPHLLIEGCVIGCYAIGAKTAYIYIRAAGARPSGSHWSGRPRWPWPRWAAAERCPREPSGPSGSPHSKTWVPKRSARSRWTTSRPGW